MCGRGTGGGAPLALPPVGEVGRAQEGGVELDEVGALRYERARERRRLQLLNFLEKTRLKPPKARGSQWVVAGGERRVRGALRPFRPFHPFRPFRHS